MRPVQPTAAVFSAFLYLLTNITTLRRYVEVNTTYGPIRGVRNTARNAKSYIEFLSIPYAKPPINNLRFEPPQPPDPWTKTLETTFNGHACPQYEYLTHLYTGVEDCLYLNVYTHQVYPEYVYIPKESLKPVIVFLYGGLLMSGFSSSYTGTYFMDEEIVLVVVNYRLNSLGFLNTEDGLIRGNMGLKDQVMSLRWVQQNIRYFGGDPNSVTLVGHSAGGASVHLHMMSHLSTGLFHRGISLSSTALSHWARPTAPKLQAQLLAKDVGCPYENSNTMIQCLKKVPVKRIQQFHRNYLEPTPDPITLYGASIEVESDDAFLSTDPTILLNEGTFPNHVPWIAGVTNGEGLLVSGYLSKQPALFKQLQDDYSSVFARKMRYTGYPNAKEISAQLLWYYFRGQIPTLKNFHELTRFFNDAAYYVGFHEGISRHISSSREPVYAYYFTYQSEYSLVNSLNRMTGFRIIPRVLDYAVGAGAGWLQSKVKPSTLERLGVCHTDDINLLFDIPTYGSEITQGSQDYPFSSAFVKLIVTFARNGKPGKFYGVDWKPAQIDRLGIVSKMFQLGEIPKYIPLPFRKSVQLWRSLHIE